MADQTEDPGRVLKDIAAGTCGGIAQVLCGQPFDTTKVRLQSAPEGTYSGPLDVVRKLVQKEGLGGFYKGTLTPLVGVGACVSIQFGVNEYMKRFWTLRNAAQGLTDTRLTMTQFYASGVAAGFCNGFLLSPIEHVRIRLQTQDSGPKLFQGPIDCIRKLYTSGGLRRGLFRGLSPTLVRESHGMGMYFLTYEALVKHDIETNNVERKDISGLRLCAYGALAGNAMWLAVYPVDVIKSRLQTDKIVPAQQTYKGPLDCAQKIMASNGIKGFFRGFVPTMLRAAPVNAATFYAFELTIRMLG